MSRLAEGSVDLVVTSPPYNLGISYGKYSDRQDRRSYLGWCGEWAGQVRRVLRPDGSFFLNIGAAPSNPMLPHEIVMTLREFFVLQNTIHWIKSIAIDTNDGKTDVRHPHLNPLSAPPGRDPNPDAERRVRVEGGLKTFGHFKPINSPRFLNDCHEYVFHFTKSGRVELNRLALGVPYQDKSNIARWSSYSGRRSALPREHVVRPLRNNSKSRERTAASGDVSSSTRRMVHQTARSVAGPIPCWILFSASEIQPSQRSAAA